MHIKIYKKVQEYDFWKIHKSSLIMQVIKRKKIYKNIKIFNKTYLVQSPISKQTSSMGGKFTTVYLQKKIYCLSRAMH